MSQYKFPNLKFKEEKSYKETETDYQNVYKVYFYQRDTVHYEKVLQNKLPFITKKETETEYKIQNSNIKKCNKGSWRDSIEGSVLDFHATILGLMLCTTCDPPSTSRSNPWQQSQE